MADVFISYSRKDEAFAQQLTAALAEQKRDVWLDRQDIEFSADWKRRVLRGVEEARVFVCILSPDYATSAVCREEANHAIAHNKRLVTILRRPVDFTMLLPAITAINALPFAETDDFVAGVQKLTTALDTDFDWLDQHTRLLQRALDWDRKARDKSLILRGSELRAAEEWLAAAGNARERNPTQLQTEYILISRRASNRRLRTLLGIAIAVIALTIVLAALALIQRGVARTERARAEQRTREVSQNLSRSDFLEATRRLRTNEGGAALAYLARALRVDPQNRVAQQRLVSLLSQRNWQFPLLNPLVHTDGVWSAEFSPDGKRIVTSGGANPVQLWNIVNGERIAELVTTPTISKVLFSRDGTRIAVVYDREFGDPSAQSVRCQLFEGITGKALMELPPHDGSLAVASFAGDSKRLLLGLRLNNGGGEVCVYDLATSAPAQTLLFSINAVPEAFEASGARAIMLEHNGDEKAKVARVWDLRTGKPTTRPFPHQEEVESAIFSPDGDHIATRTRSRAFVWELASDRLLYSTEPGPESQFLSQITYSPDAKLLVTIDAGHPTRQTDWTAQIYHALTGAVLGPGVRDHGLFGDVAFSPDSKLLLLCSSGQRARVWFVPSPDTVEPQEATAPLEHSDAVTVAKMSPDGQRIVTGSFDRTLRVWDASAGIGELSPEKLSSANPVFFTDVSANGTRFATVSSEPSGVQIWDLAKHQPLTRFLPQSVRAMQFSADGRRLITGGDDGIGRISDSTSGQLIAELKHPTPGQIDRVCLNHDGTRAVTATASSVVLWKLGDDHPIPLPSKVGVEVFPGVNFTPNGLLVVTARDGELNAWDVATGKRVWGPVTFAPATDVRLSPDGRRFAAFGQGEVVGLFETTTGKLEHSLTHRGVAVDAIFSADGELVATCSFLMKTSGYAQVWESATGAAITQPLEGEEELHQVRLSPDSTLVCATERSGRVRVWSIATGRECVDPLPHDAAAFPAWFVDAGQKVLTVANGSVQFHELWELGEMAPPWLPDLAEAVGGLGVSDKGVAVPLQNRIHLLSSLREKINANADSDSFSKWARWFFARKHRSGSPFSAQTTSAALTSR